MAEGIGTAKSPTLPEMLTGIEQLVGEAHGIVDKMLPRATDSEATPEAVGIQASAARAKADLESLCRRLDSLEAIVGTL